MSSHRILNYINTAIGVAVALALGAAYWYAYRPLPKTSGSVSAFVGQRVTIARDRQGVPHITAATVEDALFAQGYAAAQDRLWQMDGLRRFAAGELSEVIGPTALDSDREARTLRLRHLADDTTRTIPAADRATLAAYVRGINAF
ncbi:MAG: penicillin acylase family protein, partial [Bryobacteraceae bacterium]